jgi:hypothetical protein
MVQRESWTGGREPFLDVRKLAALDLALHGPRWILAAFAAAVCLCGGLGILGLRAFVRHPGHPHFAAFVGVFLVGIALNYVVLLLYAVGLVRGWRARQDAAFEPADRDAEARRYTLRSGLLLLPLVVPALAIRQEVGRRAHRKR